MKTITVKGTGKLSQKPDLITVSMQLSSEDKEYDKAMQKAAEKTDHLNRAVETIGFAKNAVKTTDFNIRTKYESIKNRNGNYENVFCGYVCTHSLKIEFDFDTARLAEVLSALSGCMASPELSVAFSVKDPAALRRELLRSAAENAREKAEILCAAAGVRLGELTTIDYSFGDISAVSDTGYTVGSRRMIKAEAALCAVDMTPDDIRVSDTVTFVWEIC